VRIAFVDERDDKREVFEYEGGLREFVRYVNRNKTAVHDSIIWFRSQQDAIAVELAVQWNDSYQESMYCYTNNIPQKDGGTHVAGFRSALTRTLNNYIEREYPNRDKIAMTGDDAREGLTAILSVKMPDPKFSSQTKDKLVSSEIKGIVESAVGQAGRIPARESLAGEGDRGEDRRCRTGARSGAQSARDDAAQGRARYRGPARQARGLPGEGPGAVRDVPGRGRQAGGSAKQGRDRRTQAILPLKGKILNVEKARFDKMIVVCGGGHAHHGARLRHRARRVRHRQAALPPRDHHERRRRRPRVRARAGGRRAPGAHRRVHRPHARRASRERRRSKAMATRRRSAIARSARSCASASTIAASASSRSRP
jgi:DNA gyrase subunit B